MSGLEIERKFLVKKGGAYKRAAFSSSRIRQGYIPCEGATVRIRTRETADGEQKAYLTIKGRPAAGSIARYEFEKEILPAEAEQLLRLCFGGVIDKTRYLVKSGDHTFEVDEFYGKNEGLVMAEVELSAEDEEFERSVREALVHRPRGDGRPPILQQAHAQVSFRALARHAARRIPIAHPTTTPAT